MAQGLVVLKTTLKIHLEKLHANVSYPKPGLLETIHRPCREQVFWRNYFPFSTQLPTQNGPHEVFLSLARGNFAGDYLIKSRSTKRLLRGYYLSKLKGARLPPPTPSSPKPVIWICLDSYAP